MSRAGEVGRRGEDIAAEYLERRGMKVLCRNFHSRHGEIDIIARDGEYTVFVEVKARSSQRYGRGIEAIGARKRNAVARTAQLYAYENGLLDTPMRFDAVEVDFSDGKIKVRYLKNADFTE